MPGGHDMTRILTSGFVLLFSVGAIHALASAVGSSLACQFNGAGQYLSNAGFSTLTNNFGIEAWVMPNSTNVGNCIIAYNGNTGLDGWGLLQSGNTFSGNFGGVTIIGSASATPNAWTHLALVRNNGTNTFFVNGVPVGTSSNAPASPSSGFSLGAPPQSPTGQFFNGAIDEVRVFTFAPGEFNASDLWYSIPPPSLIRPAMLGNGTFSFSFSNSAAVPYEILLTTNLALPLNNWNVMGAPVSAGGNLFEFTDAMATNALQRYYRLRFP